MKLKCLTSGSGREIVAEIVKRSGETLVATFEVSHAGGIAVAHPREPIFDHESITVDEIRAIVSAVVAFDAAASAEAVSMHPESK